MGRRRAIDGEWVYFIFCPAAALIKIGYTSNLLTRIGPYFTESPVRLKFLGAIPGDIAIERSWHQRFGGDLHHGEWFRLSRALLDAIATADGFDVDPIGRRQREDDAPVAWPELSPAMSARRQAFVDAIKAKYERN